MNKPITDYETIRFIMSSYNKKDNRYLKSGDPVEVKTSDGATEIIGYVDYVNDNILTGEWTATVLPVEIDYSLPEEEIQKIRAEQSVVYVLHRLFYNLREEDS